MEQSGNAQSTDIVGFVEKLDTRAVSGWVFSRTGLPIRLTLELSGEIVALQHSVAERGDVAESHGQIAMQSGFVAFIANDERVRLRELLLSAPDDIRILANGVALKRLDRPAPAKAASTASKGSLKSALEKAGKRLRRATGLLAERAMTRDNLSGRIETTRTFTLHGWALESGKAAPVDLYCNDVRVQAMVARESRADLIDAQGRKIINAGFVIDLPTSIWQHAQPGGECRLQVRSHGIVLPPNLIAVSRSTAAEWVHDIVQQPESAEKQFLQMQALEHAHAARLLDALEPSARDGLLAFARWLKVEDRFFRSRDARKEALVPSESLDTLLLWDAMRDLNDRLLARPDSVVREIVATIKAHPLTEIARDWFLNLAVQLACDHDELDRLRESVDFSRFHALAQGKEQWARSLVVPVLVADERVELATEQLEALAAQKDGWLQTGCLLHAVRQVIAGERAGSIPAERAEGFRVAYTRLLHSMMDDWFSRLQDLDLLDGMVQIILARDQYSDFHEREMSEAALRFYGLSPTFWERLEARGGIPADGVLAVAHDHWQACLATLRGFDQGLEPSSSCALALDWFLTRGAADALTFLREIIARTLVEPRLAQGAAFRQHIELLLRHSQVDALRIAAFPGLESTAELLPAFLETPVGDAIRYRSDCKLSAHSRLQRLASERLRQLAERLDAQADFAPEILTDLDRAAILLADARASHLGADLLAGALAMLHHRGLKAPSLLTRLREQLLRAIRDTPEKSVPSAPVLTAIARLGQMPSDPLARAVHEEAADAIEARFPPLAAAWESLAEDSHAAALRPSMPPTKTATGSGWLADTLVVVPCQGSIDSPLRRRIRESWGAALRSVGIRVIFLLQEPPTEPESTTDSLVVPPEANEIPSLLLLRGLLHVHAEHRSAYLIVAPADGYLSVRRLIDLANYRKHHYHGRIITRADTDLKKNDDKDAVGLMDKSPADTYFVDHETGICLSAHALDSLALSSRTVIGQRLLADARHPGKLIGDLLALSAIYPSDEEFHCHRRQAPGGSEVRIAHRSNTFLPGPDTPTILTNAGGDDDYAAIARGAEESGLRPGKLWPSTQAPSLGRNTNQLELLSSPAALSAARETAVTVVAVMRNERVILPHFLAHYRRLGAGTFIVVDNCSDDGTREYLLAQPDVITYSTDTEYRLSHYGVTWQHTVLANHCLGKWVVLADADEFLVYPDCERTPLADFVSSMAADGADAALVRMIDMYPFGDLDEADFTREEPFRAAPCFDRKPLIELMFGGGQFSNSRNFVNGLRHRIAPSRINAYVSQKYALFRYQPWMRISEGVHYTANMRCGGHPAFFAHFKYHAGFKEKVITEVQRKQHYNAGEEYRRYAAMLAEGKGAFGDPELTARYQDSRSFLAVTDPLDQAKDQQTGESRASDAAGLGAE